MEQNGITSINALWEAAVRWLPTLSAEEQRAGLILLRELAKGEALTAAQVARALGTGSEATEALLTDTELSRFIQKDEEHRILGFWGLSVTRTHHRFSVKGRALWTWCAQDGLFLPQLLDETAEIESLDPQSGELIRLTVQPCRVEAADPLGVVLSQGNPGTWDSTSATGIRATACRFIYFFASRDSAHRWQEKNAKHRETVLLSLTEAFRYGMRYNRHLYGPELARLRSEAECSDSSMSITAHAGAEPPEQ